MSNETKDDVTSSIGWTVTENDDVGDEWLVLSASPLGLRARLMVIRTFWKLRALGQTTVRPTLWSMLVLLVMGRHGPLDEKGQS